jgi:hypothetical protein
VRTVTEISRTTLFRVPKLPARATQAARNVDWRRVYETARIVVRYAGEAWGRLNESERRELQRLVTASRGRLNSLSAADRSRMRQLVLKAIGLNR